MSIEALLLVIAAAILHAVWNLVTKQVNGKMPFFWLMAAMSSVVCLPFVLWQLWETPVAMSTIVWVFVAGSAVLHLFYFIILQTGYRKADLSVVYPLARGSGPFISVAGAILFFGERPGWLALTGVVLIIGGVLIMTGLKFRANTDKRLQAGILYGTLTGLFIAMYTLWDRSGVVDNGVSPVLITFGSMILPLILLLPVVIKQKQELQREIREHWKQALLISICQPLSYVLVLIAIKTTPVSYVAPARELSIVFGVFFGANVLKEADAKRRIIAALIILGGIVFLAVD